MTQIVHAVGVIFEDTSGNILVLRRHESSPEGDTWGLVGGNIDPGEDSVTAALREVREEINHVISPKDLIYARSYGWKRLGLDLRFEVYKYFVPKENVSIDLDTTENTEYMWAKPSDLHNRNDLMEGLYPILEDEYKV